MKMNNKAFTIVELLSVLALLVIILLVSYPNFSKMAENAKSKHDSSIKILAKSAAKMYVNNNKEEMNTYFTNNPDSKYCLPLAKLAAYDFIDSYLEDSSKKEIDMKSCVNITRKVENNKIKYSYELSDTDKVSSDVDYLPPILVVKDKSSKTIEIECENTMKVTKDVFNANCEVVASDDKATNIEILLTETTVNGDIVITYTATDGTNNAKPLKLKLLQ